MSNSEYDDRTKWSDEQLIDAAIRTESFCDNRELRAALLKRMGQAEAGLCGTKVRTLELLRQIQSSQKGNIGSINTHYLPQLRCNEVDELVDVLTNPVRAEAPKEETPAEAEFDMGGFFLNDSGHIYYHGNKPTTKEDAIELSIKKWEVITYLLATNKSNRVENSSGSCGLCILYGSRCEGCPVVKRTGLEGCKGTPWKLICTKVAEAEAELEFLKSLRETPAPKPRFAIAGTEEALEPGVTVLELSDAFYGDTIDLKGNGQYLIEINKYTGRVARIAEVGYRLGFPLDEQGRLKIEE